MNDPGGADIIFVSALLTGEDPPRLIDIKSNGLFFSQGTNGKTVFYLTSGRGRLSVSSKSGKHATIALFAAGDFVGEESLASGYSVRIATATALTRCLALEITRDAMIRMIQEDRACSDLFIKSLLARSMRLQTALVDQRFNSSAKRLAKVLILMAEINKTGRAATVIPHISQAALAEMIGVTRSRVNFLLKHFAGLGYIDFGRSITVRKSLVNILLYD